MQYGLSEEPDAVLAYSKVAQVPVTPGGLWVNKKYLHLGVSPDGLILTPSSNALIGIIEVKCIKALRTKTVSEWIKSGIPSSACVSLKNGKLELKRNHAYYFQVQMQLLVTEAAYCDFVLHSRLGDPFVERILPDENLQQNIVERTGQFWHRVLVPEYYMQRVPRELLPIIFN